MANGLLSITNNVTTLEILSASNPQGTYRLAYDSMALPVAKRFATLLRNGPPYHDMLWELGINIHGATAAASYAAYQALVSLFESVSEWNENGVGNPVTVTFLPKNSARTSGLQTTVIELIEISTPRNFLETGDNFVILNITLRFISRPGYYEPSGTGASGNSLAQLTRQAVNFAASHAYFSPLKATVGITSALAAPSSNPPKATLFLAGQGAAISSVPCVQAGGTGSNGYTSVADAANYAPYNILRWLAPVANTWYPVPGSVTMYDTSHLNRVNTFMAYVVCRLSNNINVKIRGKFAPVSGMTLQTGREVAVPYNNGNVQVLYLGAFSFPVQNASPIGPFYFECYADSTVSSFDLCTMITINDTPAASVITMETLISSTLARDYVIDPRYAGVSARPQPEVAIYTPSYERNLVYEGNAYNLTQGQNVGAVLVFPYSTRWQLPNAGNTAGTTYNLALERRALYPTPY